MSASRARTVVMIVSSSLFIQHLDAAVIVTSLPQMGAESASRRPLLFQLIFGYSAWISGLMVLVLGRTTVSMRHIGDARVNNWPLGNAQSLPTQFNMWTR